MLELYRKQKLALRYFLVGKGFFRAIRAMEFAEEFHNGNRIGGQPEFSHQIAIAHYVRTLQNVESILEDLICTVLLHDVVEDYRVSLEDIESQFGEKVAQAVDLVSKEVAGAKKNLDDYFNAIPSNLIAALTKGGDRIHNHQTMIGAFSVSKQKRYITETEKYILPLIKKARRAFPEHEAAFENIKHVLIGQIELITAIHSVKEE